MGRVRVTVRPEEPPTLADAPVGGRLLVPKTAVVARLTSAALIAAINAGETEASKGPAVITRRMAGLEEVHTEPVAETVLVAFMPSGAPGRVLLETTRLFEPIIGLAVRELKMEPLKTRRIVAREAPAAHRVPIAMGGAKP